jgi:inhibitor of cysteine peptidase
MNRAPLVVASALLSLWNCGMQRQMISVDESSNGRQVVLQTGQPLKITLNENASTGYRWMVQATPDILRESAAQNPEGPKGPPGKGGVRTFSFEAVRPGSGELELDYRRSWEKTAQPARTFKLRIRVE